MPKCPIALGLLLAASGALASASAQAADGSAIFAANCKKCHGATGVPSAPIKKMFPKIPTFDASFFATRSDADLARRITEGKDQMKPFRDTLTADEIAAVAKYIRTLGN